MNTIERAPAIQVVGSGILYDNPIPDLRSRNGYFPNAAVLTDRTLIGAYAEGEAFESTDMTTIAVISTDNGDSWQKIGPIYDKTRESKLTTDYLKMTVITPSHWVAFGYRFDRGEADSPVGNPATGGLRNSEVIWFETVDGGQTWTGPKHIAHTMGKSTEASSPLVILQDGSWVTPISCFADWDGNCPEGYYGRLLRSDDNGETWRDETITMEFPGRGVTIWEQRLCQLETGPIVVVAWNENIRSGEQYCNHYSISDDNGKTFSEPRSTGILGQTASVVSLGGTLLLSLHSLRKHTETPGIKACIVDIDNGDWNIVQETMLWEPPVPLTRNEKAIKQFAFLKFGQPSAVRLHDGTYFMTHWSIEEGQGKILWTKFRVSV